MQPTSLMEWALWNAERGFKVFPIKPGAKYPPLMKRPYEHATTDPGQVMLWWLENPDANIGIDTSDLLVVDVDKKGNRDGYQALHALGIESDDTYVVSTPSGGQHRYYRVDHPVAGSVETLGVGVDTRGFHNYVLGAGSVTAAGRYDPSTDGRVIQAPECVRTRTSPPKARDEAPLIDLDTPSAIALAREFARNAEPAIEGERGDEHTYKVACRVREFGVSEDMCFEILLDLWNETCDPPWEPDHLRKKVESAYLYGIAQPGSAHPDVLFEGVNVDPEPAPPRSRWFNHGDDWRGSVKWLYKNVLPTTGVALLTASSQAGKTFVGLHLAHSLAREGEFFGVKPKHRGGTIVLAAEGFGSIKHRMAALGEDGERLPISVCPVGALAANGAWKAICADVRDRAVEMREEFGLPVRLIVIDTLSASGILDDENDNAKAATVMKAFAELSMALDALVFVTHHPPKSGHGERGAGAIRNNADYVMEIRREGESVVRTLDLTKGRDAEQRSLGNFTLVPVSLGVDEDGDPIETMVLSVGAPAFDRGRPPAHAEKFLEVLDNVIAVPGDCDVEGDAVEHDGFRTEWRIATGSYPRRDQRSNAHKAFAKLLDFYVKNLTVEEIVLEGGRYIRKKDIKI